MKIGHPDFVLHTWNIGEFELCIMDFFFYISITFGCKGIVWKLLFYSITTMVKGIDNWFSKEGIDKYTLFRYISLSVILSLSP